MTRTVYTKLTPLPAGIPRSVVLSLLHGHLEMIDLSPLVEHREKITRPPPKATAEEFHAAWYQITDRISYMPGIKGKVTYHVCFHDLDNGVQTRCYAPMGLDIKDKWTVGGNEPGEPRQAQEMGLDAPKDGLWLREDVDYKCNMMVNNVVKRNLNNGHKALVERLIEKAKLVDTRQYNENIRRTTSVFSNPTSPTQPSSPSQYSTPMPSPMYQQQQQQQYQGHPAYFQPQPQGHPQGPNPGHSPEPGAHAVPAPPYDYANARFPHDPKTAYNPNVPITHRGELSPQDPAAQYRMTLDQAVNPNAYGQQYTSDAPGNRQSNISGMGSSLDPEHARRVSATNSSRTGSVDGRTFAAELE